MRASSASTPPTQHHNLDTSLASTWMWRFSRAKTCLPSGPPLRSGLMRLLCLVVFGTPGQPASRKVWPSARLRRMRYAST